ncbi:MAG: hypothetical protein QOG51_1581 [Verrucomicrobiota bacterium]
MSGFIGLIFTVFMGAALAIMGGHWHDRKSRLIWAVISSAFGLVVIVSGGIYYLSPAPPVIIQNVAPAEKPYLFIKESWMEELVAGKSPVVMLEIQNGPTETTLVFSKITFEFTRFIPEKFLKYNERGDGKTTHAGPHQTFTARWHSDKTAVLSQEDIDELNATEPTAELYVYGHAEYTDETGTHPLNACWKYSKDFPGHLVFCREDVKIE